MESFNFDQNKKMFCKLNHITVQHFILLQNDSHRNIISSEKALSLMLQFTPKSIIRIMFI